MALLNKYKLLIDTARASDIEDLQIVEQDEMLRVEGTTARPDVKDKLWDIYNQIDPNYLSREVFLNITVSMDVTNGKVRVATKETSLHVRKGPGTELPIIGTAEKDEIITLISCANHQWWLIRTTDGQEGYCYSQYLEPVE